MHWDCYYDTTLDIEVDPQRRRFGCSESDFALQLGPVRTLYFNTGCRPVFPGSSRLGIEPKTPGWLVQAQPPAHRGI
jgi:hypothetical protein